MTEQDIIAHTIGVDRAEVQEYRPGAFASKVYAHGGGLWRVSQDDPNVGSVLLWKLAANQSFARLSRTTLWESP